MTVRICETRPKMEVSTNFKLKSCLLNKNQFAKLIAVIMVAFIGFSCENESLESEPNLENQNISFKKQEFTKCLRGCLLLVPH